MATDSASTVDFGIKHHEVVFVFHPEKMKVNTSQELHIPGDEFIAHAGVPNADLLNQHTMTITTGPTEGHFGVAGYHMTTDSGEKKWVRTTNRTPVYGHKLTSCRTHFQHCNIPGDKHCSVLTLRPSQDRFTDNAKINERKALPQWSNITHANLSAGVEPVGLGDDTRFLITEGTLGADNKIETKGVVHAYLKKNANLPDFFGGVYSDKRAHKTVTLKGQDAYVIKDKEHLKSIKKLMSEMAVTHSPFAKGFGINITKLHDEETRGPLTVVVGFDRDPLTDEGFKGIEKDTAISEHRARRIVNPDAKDDPHEVETGGIVQRVPGFEDVIEKAKDKAAVVADYVVRDYNEVDEVE
jgi:hypothetical protein